MAKDKKTTSSVVPTVDNVVEILNDKMRADNVIAQQAMDLIKKEKDERLIEAIKRRVLKADYKTLKGLINLRAQRKRSEIDLESLRLKGNLKVLLTGFTVDDAFMEHNKCTSDTIELEIPDGKGGYSKKKVKKGDKIDPQINYLTYDSEITKVEDKIRKMLNEVDVQFREDIRVLQANYPNYYCFDWD